MGQHELPLLSVLRAEIRVADILRQDDADPFFAQFLQAGAARVQIPVGPGVTAVAYFLQTGNKPWEGDETDFPIEGSLYIAMVDEITNEELGAFTKGDGTIAVHQRAPSLPARTPHSITSCTWIVRSSSPAALPGHSGRVGHAAHARPAVPGRIPPISSYRSAGVSWATRGRSACRPASLTSRMGTHSPSSRTFEGPVVAISRILSSAPWRVFVQGIFNEAKPLDAREWKITAGSART